MDELNVGDKISAIIGYKRGRNYDLSERRGVLIELYDDYGVIKLRNGKTQSVKRDNIRPDGKPNALTELFLKKAEKENG